MELLFFFNLSVISFILYFFYNGGFDGVGGGMEKGGGYRFYW